MWKSFVVSSNVYLFFILVVWNVYLPQNLNTLVILEIFLILFSPWINWSNS